MTQEERRCTVEALKRYVERYPSQNKAAASLKGVSSATLSAILNGKLELISDDMLRSVMAQIAPGVGRDGWQTVETCAFQEIRFALRDAQDYRKARWIVGDAGCGKTTAAHAYAGDSQEVFIVLCDEDMRKGDFVSPQGRCAQRGDAHQGDA